VSTVLLIDDEWQMGSLVAMCLDQAGARVVQATNLEDSLALARREKVGVVLLDIALGDEDGLAILPRLREDPALAGVPVVIFTVHDSRRHDALSHGVEGFVTKPFSPIDLGQLLEEHMKPEED
jgi:DNA-binding response OmpR family regulator